jgi:hypothetical protein
MTYDMDGAARRAANADARLRGCPAFRHAVHRVWRLGPRPVGELLLEVATDRGRLIRALERYAGIDPALVDAADARDWIRPAALMRKVEP